MAEKNKSRLTMRAAEIVTALAILPLGAIVVYDSIRVGRGWASDGPQAGFYPFYVGLILCAAALAILLQACFAARSKHPGAGAERDSATFVEAAQFRKVLAILLPSIAYVAVIYLLGIYVASALFLTIFMCWQGKYSVFKALPIGLAVPLAMFMLFEVWFKVSLPKGPLETMLGY